MRWFVPLIAVLAACSDKSDTDPVANAGPDQVLVPGDTAYLDGTASSDTDGLIKSYAWQLMSAPPDSVADFDDPAIGFPAWGITNR